MREIRRRIGTGRLCTGGGTKVARSEVLTRKVGGCIGPRAANMANNIPGRRISYGETFYTDWERGTTQPTGREGVANHVLPPTWSEKAV